MKENNLHDNNIHEEASRNLSFALILNLLFNIVVIGGGISTNSVAIISDALHDLSDTFSILIAWILEKLSSKESTEEFTYGFQRFSIFGALFNSTIVILASLFVVYESFNRLFITQSPDASGMVLIAILGIIFKGASLIRLNKGKTFNENAISIHMFGDVFEWIALLIISIILVFADIPILDPISSILVSVWVIYNLGKTFIASAKILLQSTPSNLNLTELKRDLLEVDNIEEIKEFHLWSLDGIENILTAKFKVNLSTEDSLGYETTYNDLMEVANDYGISQTTFEFELESPNDKK